MAVPQDWTVFTIRDRLAAKGIRTLAQLARRVGLDKRAVSAALHRPHEAGERAIARTLGIQAAQIWPSRYDRQGRRLKPQPPENYGRGRTAGHGQTVPARTALNRKSEIAA